MNPLLSEFSVFSGKFKEGTVKIQGIYIAAIYFILGLIGCWLSYIAGTYCMVAIFSNNLGESTTLRFGYLAEFNHGIYNTIILPIIVLIAFVFVDETTDVIGRLIKTNRLAITGRISVMEYISYYNRRIFLIITPLIIGLIGLYVFVHEMSVKNKPEFGWVQARTLYILDQQQSNSYFDEQSYDKLQEEFKKRFGGSWNCVRAERLCDKKGDNIDCNGVYLNELTTNEVREGPFSFFLYYSLILQVLTIAFPTWIGMKLVFVISLFARAMRKPDKRLKAPVVIPYWQDEEYFRMGLAPLDRIYMRSLILVAASAFVFYLQAFANVPKGTSFFIDFGSNWIGQALVLIGIVIAGAIVYLLPAVFNFLHLRTAQQDELNRLSILQGNSEGEEKRRYDKEIQIVQKQTPWPHGVRGFFIALGVTLALLFAPLGISYLYDPFIKVLIKIGDFIPKLFCPC